MKLSQKHTWWNLKACAAMGQCFLDERKKDLRLDGQGEDEGLRTMHVQCSGIKYVQKCLREREGKQLDVLFFVCLFLFVFFIYVNIWLHDLMNEYTHVYQGVKVFLGGIISC